MTFSIRSLKISFSLLAALAFASQAQAQATRTWVSGVGDDANPCSRTAPCKTFAGAISKTAAGGEISVLDPGGFGAVNITKAITINGDGTLAGILASLTTGIIVNAGVNDVVVIKNISINGAGNGINGIRWLAGKQLIVDTVDITGFTTRGISVERTSTGGLFVYNTRFTNTNVGIRLNTTAGVVGAIIDGVNIEGVTTGIDASTGSLAVITNSTISSCATNGVTASVSGSTVAIKNSNLSLSGTCVNTVSGAIVRLSGNTIVSCGVGVNLPVGATVQSDGTNNIAANGSTAPVLSTYTSQ